MTALIQQYPLACLLAAFMAGGSLGFLGLALCVAARDGDGRCCAFCSSTEKPAARPEPRKGIGVTPSPLITPAAAAGPTERRQP